MSPSSRLGGQLSQVSAARRQVGARYALIGGLALASHKVIRATQDIDLLVEAEKADAIDAKLASFSRRAARGWVSRAGRPDGRDRGPVPALAGA
jgi:Aminoglycoside-2''-adenylyltransferase